MSIRTATYGRIISKLPIQELIQTPTFDISLLRTPGFNFRTMKKVYVNESNPTLTTVYKPQQSETSVDETIRFIEQTPSIREVLFITIDTIMSKKPLEAIRYLRTFDAYGGCIFHLVIMNSACILEL